MRRIGLVGLAVLVAAAMAGCGGGGGRVVTGPGLVGLDDSSSSTAPLLTVTYTIRPSTVQTTVQILSDLASDGDIAFDPVLNFFTVTTPPPTSSPMVLFGVDSLNPDLPEYRAFLTFPLDGFTGQPVVPGNASIVSADVEVFVDRLDFASAVPTFLDLVRYSFRGLAAADFNAVPLATRPEFDFFSSDVGNFVRIEVTSLMQEAQLQGLLDFQLRFSRDMSVPPLAPSSPSAQAGRTVVPPPRAMDNIVPNRPTSPAKPLSPADLASRHR